MEVAERGGGRSVQYGTGSRGGGDGGRESRLSGATGGCSATMATVGKKRWTVKLLLCPQTASPSPSPPETVDGDETPTPKRQFVEHLGESNTHRRIIPAVARIWEERTVWGFLALAMSRRRWWTKMARRRH